MTIHPKKDQPLACAYFSRTRLLESLADPAAFTLTFELVPGRGARGQAIDRILSLTKDIAADGRIQAVSITENAGGHPALSPETLGAEALELGLEAIIHLSCKDKNRNQIESLLFAWDRAGLRNLLVIAGDYPRAGFRGHPKPVFDLDTVQLLDQISALNNGVSCRADGTFAPARFQPTSFCKGVAVSPFKETEAEQVTQYAKLHRKIAAGADFAITQLGYDPRKFQELLLYMKQNALSLPVLGNVFIPSPQVARAMFRGEIPGCVIPPALYKRMEIEFSDSDRGKKARLLRGAKLLAVLKGLGCAGAHIGGPGLSFKEIDFLLTEAGRREDNWRESCRDLFSWPEDGFFYFRKDAATGLNQTETTLRRTKRPAPWFSAMRMVHTLFFTRSGLFYPAMKRFFLWCADCRFHGALNRMEHVMKFLAFGCRNCGDCTLAELGFYCPQSGCAKYLLNGPCGGSRKGWCEVYPGEKVCFYVKLYRRLKTRGLEGSLQQGYVPPRNWGLHNTSSWLNFYRGVDHSGGDMREMKYCADNTEKGNKPVRD